MTTRYDGGHSYYHFTTAGLGLSSGTVVIYHHVTPTGFWSSIGLAFSYHHVTPAELEHWWDSHLLMFISPLGV